MLAASAQRSATSSVSARLPPSPAFCAVFRSGDSSPRGGASLELLRATWQPPAARGLRALGQSERTHAAEAESTPEFEDNTKKEMQNYLINIFISIAH